jgi:hypothetical protein
LTQGLAIYKEERGVYIRKYLPPGRGRGYQPMSFGGNKYEIG